MTSGEALTNAKPSGKTRKLAVHHRVPRWAFGQESEAEMGVNGSAMPATRQDPHVTVQLDDGARSTNQNGIPVNPSTVTSLNVEQPRVIKNSALIEDAAPIQVTTRDLITGNHGVDNPRSVSDATLNSNR